MINEKINIIIVKTTNGDIGIASAKNVELTGGEELIDTPYGQLAVGRINQLEESDCSDDDEELEEGGGKCTKVTKKASSRRCVCGDV